MLNNVAGAATTVAQQTPQQNLCVFFDIKEGASSSLIASRAGDIAHTTLESERSTSSFFIDVYSRLF
jgi:hypothetical protein